MTNATIIDNDVLFCSCVVTVPEHVQGCETRLISEMSVLRDGKDRIIVIGDLRVNLKRSSIGLFSHNLLTLRGAEAGGTKGFIRVDELDSGVLRIAVRGDNLQIGRFYLTAEKAVEFIQALRKLG